ncbi:MAG: ABC transporter permease [Candidatus Nomurabacteria bacterium]|jgi:ABC-2 type transport system permease protein|nr:ABC transporter permease [Candidatus Nomurabacteria bacterium]
MRAILTYAITMFRRFLRDPVYIFFIFFFPLIFLFIFGTIFGGNNSVTFNVALINHSESEFSTNFVEQVSTAEDGVFKVKSEVQNLDEAKEMMSRGELDSIIELPTEFGEVQDGLPTGTMKVYYDPAQSQSGQTIASIMSSMLDEVNIDMTGVQPPLDVEQVSTGRDGMSQFDYTFAGLFAYTLMAMSIYGLSNQLPSEKKTGALRRIKATPFRPWQLIIALALVYTLLTAISAGVMVAVGVTLFDWHIKGSILLFMAFSLVSVLALSGFGMLVAAAAKNENQAGLAAQLIAFPLMFLSGVFIPLFIMPEVFRTISHFIPLTPVAEGIRFITTEGAGLLDILPQLSLVAAWGVVAYVIAFKVFKWE